MAQDDLTKKVIESAIYVHRNLGPGLLESAYQECFSLVLNKNGIAHTNQAMMPIEFDGHIVANAYRLDMVIENRLIVELKAIEEILPIHEAQILTYLKLSKIRTGLLMNFNAKLLKDGIRRFVI
ncbi:MAG: GxxExxY protein [Alphaproteobacteria bacterium PRO2]|nr:GxxExxY protein [Alphaproteobacteria bacterium PRO2]